MATPRKEKPAETPGYWPTTKMAELFELTARRIQQLTQDGVLKTHDTPAGRRYNVGEATKDYIKYLRTQLDRKASAQNDKLETDKLLVAWLYNIASHRDIARKQGKRPGEKE